VEDTAELGAWGESQAQEYLKKLGFTILARNWRYKNRHEIDIVATYNKELIAIEVKPHAQPLDTKPFEQVNSHKFRQIRQALELFGKERNIQNVAMRVDVVSIVKFPFSIEYFAYADFTL